MKIIGMPGAVNTSAAPSVERFCATQLSAWPGQISSGTRALPLAGARPRHAIRCRATRWKASPLKRWAMHAGERVHVAGGIVGAVQQAAQRVHEAGAPLRAETGAALAVGRVSHALSCMSSAIVSFQGWRAADLVVDPLQQAPAVGDRPGRSRAARRCGCSRWRPSAGRRKAVLAASAGRCRGGSCRTSPPAVIRAACRPRACRAAPVVVEIDAAAAVLRPAVEVPEVEVVGAEMVVDDVVDDRDAAGMRRIDQAPKAVGAAIVLLDGEDVGGVVAPGDVAGELVGRHAAGWR